MNKFVLLLLPGAIALLQASACALTISVDAEVLKDSAGNPMPLTGLVVLTAGLTGSFAGPEIGSFVGSHEQFLQRWDLAAWSTDGVFSGITGDLALGGDWDQGDPLALYWYPTLTMASPAPVRGTPYGFYRSESGLDGSAPWLTPAESDTIALTFFTADASFLFTSGSNAAEAALASFSVVPEPSTWMSATLLLGALGSRTGRRRIA